MNLKKLLLASCVTAALLGANAAHADDEADGWFTYHQENADLTFGAGVFDLGKDHDTAEFHLQYRFADRWGSIRPLIGAMATAEGGVYGYAGFGFDWKLSDHWYTYPHISVGAYSDGGGKDLGHVVEFRSAFEIGYQFDNNMRFGAAFSHMSNASLGDKNPGEESLIATFSIPFSF